MKGTILVIANDIRGLHCFRKEVLKAFRDSGYDVYISVPDYEESYFFSYFKEIGCTIIKTKFERRGINPFADFKLMLRYRKIIKQLKPFVVLTYTIKPNIYGGIACRLTKTPQIANVTGLGDAVENGGWLKFLTIVLYRIGIGRAKTVFFQNLANREFCIQHGIAKKVSTVLPGSGVNLSYHCFQEYPVDGVIKFIFIARLIKDKGLEELFETAKYIKSKYPKTEFQILGKVEGNYCQQLDELVMDGKITYLGFKSDIRPYLKCIHCSIMPSYHEGLSNVNLESAANGRPVITTDVPGCRETVCDGVTGFLVKARNSHSLIEGVERFLSLSYQQKKHMGAEGRKKVEKEFDRQLVIKAYLNEIDSITII